MTESPTTPPRDPEGFDVPVTPPPASEPASQPTRDAPPVLDAGTYTALRTPRSSGALVLDGSWHQISPRYVVSQFVQNGIFIAVLVVAALIVGIALDQSWVWIPAGIVIAVTLITLIILPRQAKALGYMLREDDVVFRRGILWQRMVAVPYGRMQLVDITQGPLDRAFGVSQLKMVTAAATTGVQIPGLSQEAAEALRDTLIEVAETRRTGL
ncbi:PH domain-containing protein [Microbacterium sp. MAHUQ-60]|uniref:PH domain-containing protein n=1 Tax=unclassified Microbacterium TaxID=2609290 RepID=UPI00361F28FE